MNLDVHSTSLIHFYSKYIFRHVHVQSFAYVHTHIQPVSFGRVSSQNFENLYIYILWDSVTILFFWYRRHISFRNAVLQNLKTAIWKRILQASFSSFSVPQVAYLSAEVSCLLAHAIYCNIQGITSLFLVSL